MIGGSGFYAFLDDPEEVDGQHAVRRPLGAGLASARSPDAGWRSCRGTGADHELPAAPDQLPRQPLGAALRRRAPGARPVRGRRAAAERRARGPRGARPAGRPDLRPRRRPTSRRGAVHLPFADPYCPRLSERARRRRRRRDRRHDGRRRRARASRPAPSRSDYAAQGWSLVNMTGAPGGRAGPRDAAVLRHDRAGDRHGRRRRGGRGGAPGGGLRAVRGATSSASRRLLGRRDRPTCPTTTAAPASTWADGLDLTYEIP